MHAIPLGIVTYSCARAGSMATVLASRMSTCYSAQNEHAAQAVYDEAMLKSVELQVSK